MIYAEMNLSEPDMLENLILRIPSQQPPSYLGGQEMFPSVLIFQSRQTIEVHKAEGLICFLEESPTFFPLIDLSIR